MATVKKAPTKKSGSKSVSVADPDSLEFRKTNEAIGLRVTEGSLSLLSRKIFNVMIYHAQEMKEPGKNAPIETAAAKKYFWMKVSDLAKNASYDSRDTESLKETLESMQGIKLLMENDRQWTSERLVSSITLVNPSGLKKHSGQLWFGFAFPPEVHEQVMAPGTYTRLSLVYQRSLRSGAALGLYEVCRRYLTNPSKVTSIHDVEYWYGTITGNPVTSEPIPEYKYFKRDVLRRAIAEINMLTDIEIELIEHKNGRRVDRLQFRVEQKRQAPIPFPSDPIIDTELLNTIMSYGMTYTEAADILTAHLHSHIRAAIAETEKRKAVPPSAADPLRSPAGYFKWALRKLTPAVNTEKTITFGDKDAKVVRAAGGKTVMETFLHARAEDAMMAYGDMTDVDKKREFDAFIEQNTSKMLKTEKGLESAMVRAAFSHWYANSLWGEPSAEDMMRFMSQYPVS